MKTVHDTKFQAADVKGSFISLKDIVLHNKKLNRPNSNKLMNSGASFMKLGSCCCEGWCDLNVVLDVNRHTYGRYHSILPFNNETGNAALTYGCC